MTVKVCIAGGDGLSCRVMDEDLKQAAISALQALHDRFGTYESAATELGITRQALRDWRTKGRVSITRVRDVSRLTGIPPSTLRPDVFAPVEHQPDSVSAA